MNEVADIRYAQAVESIKLVGSSGIVDLTEDDFDFLTQEKLWIAIERSRVRRVVESAVFGPLDMVGLPRFAPPVEFIAGAIAHYVHPVNFMSACLVMEGADYAQNIIDGIDGTATASQIFAMVIRIRAGYDMPVEKKFKHCKEHLKDVSNGKEK